MKKFIISTDSSADSFRSYLAKNNVYCITMKRVLNGSELSEHYDSTQEFDNFYDTLKNGALPSTVAINPTEFQEHFQSILHKEKSGDIIHLTLSSGLSVTYDNACKAADEINKVLKDRKIYVFDSLVATHGIAHLVDVLIALRDAGATTQDGIKRVEFLRKHLQGWVIMNDLFHLRRGGRISGIRATIGTILNIKPIVHINRKGKLVIENKMKGSINSIKYLMEKIHTLGEHAGDVFYENGIYVVRTSASKLYDDLKAAVTQKYPKLKIKEAVVGPVIGTHLGCGGAIVLFFGAERLDIN